MNKQYFSIHVDLLLNPMSFKFGLKPDLCILYLYLISSLNDLMNKHAPLFIHDYILLLMYLKSKIVQS